MCLLPACIPRVTEMSQTVCRLKTIKHKYFLVLNASAGTNSSSVLEKYPSGGLQAQLNTFILTRAIPCHLFVSLTKLQLDQSLFRFSVQPKLSIYKVCTSFYDDFENNTSTHASKVVEFCYHKWSQKVAKLS